MPRIAIVEDTEQERLRLQGYISDYCREKGLEETVFLFADGESFLAAYPEELDIVLLDIEMHELDGMETARRLRAFDRKVQILFVTHLVQYAIEGYAVDAADFIAKPVQYPAFRSSMERVMEKIAFYTPRFLMTSYAREPISCQVQRVAFIESLNKKTIIHTADGGEILSSEPLYALEEKLKGEAFFRCHNAYLVNLAHVKTVGSNELSVMDKQLPISKYRKRDFLQALAACRGKIL